MIIERGITSETNNITTDYSFIIRMFPSTLSYICVTMKVKKYSQQNYSQTDSCMDKPPARRGWGRLFILANTLPRVCEERGKSDTGA
jgi:hypothetical protein